MRGGYGGTWFVWNLVMSALSAATIISQPRVEVILQQQRPPTQQREEHEYGVDARVRRHEVRVEFGDVGVECAVEAARCRERRRPG